MKIKFKLTFYQLTLNIIFSLILTFPFGCQKALSSSLHDENITNFDFFTEGEKVDNQLLQHQSQKNQSNMSQELNNNHNQNNQNHSNKIKKQKIVTLRGKLIFKEIPPVMSVEAYKGEEFFLIPNSSNQISSNKTPSNKKQLVLRSSAQVSETQLKNFQNQMVEIKAEYTEGKRPSASTTACPVDINGQCMPQGAGYRVLSIKHNH
jgi:hypothetical protein